MSELSKIAEDLGKLVRLACERVERGVEISPRLLDIYDASRYLGMSDKAIRELITDGSLNYIQKIPGRSPYLLDVKDLDAWILKNKIRAGE